jgi:hypothetical protein
MCAGGLSAAWAAHTGLAHLIRISVDCELAMALLTVMLTVWSAMFACAAVHVGLAQVAAVMEGHLRTGRSAVRRRHGVYKAGIAG